MLLFAIGLMAGVALGMIIVGFLAIGAYDRGYTDALERRKAWRGQLVAGPDGRVDRGTVRADGEHDAVLLLDDRADAKPALGHGPDDGPHLIVASQIGCGLRCDPAHGLSELVEERRRTANGRADERRNERDGEEDDERADEELHRPERDVTSRTFHGREPSSGTSGRSQEAPRPLRPRSRCSSAERAVQRITIRKERDPNGRARYPETREARQAHVRLRR